MRYFILLVAPVIAACGTMANYYDKPASEVSNAVEVEYDAEFDDAPTFVGPPLRNNALMYATGGRGEKYFLRSTGTSFESATHQLYVSSSKTQWQFYNRMTLSGGINVEFYRIDSRVGACSQYGCSNLEDVVGIVPANYLRDHAESGFSARISGKRGELKLDVPKSYIRGYIQSMEDYFESN